MQLNRVLEQHIAVFGEAGSGKFLLGRNASTGRLVGAGNERPKIGGGRKRKQPEE